MTSHVLDTALGRPAQGVLVTLQRAAPGSPGPATAGTPPTASCRLCTPLALVAGRLFRESVLAQDHCSAWEGSTAGRNQVAWEDPKPVCIRVVPASSTRASLTSNFYRWMMLLRCKFAEALVPAQDYVLKSEPIDCGPCLCIDGAGMCL